MVWTSFGIVCLFNLLTMTFAIAASVKISWAPNNPAPEGYRVFARKSNHHFDYTTPVWEGSDTACTVNGLDDNTEYFFVIQPFHGEVKGDCSSEIHYVPPVIKEQQTEPEALVDQHRKDNVVFDMFADGGAPQEIPLPPIPLSADFYKGNEYFLVLSLDEQSTLNGNTPEATHWQIYETQSKNCILDLISDRQLSQLRVSKLLFKNGIKYYWRARFFNSKGRISDWSPPHFFTSDSTPGDTGKHGGPT
jgi:hypothetical protein